MSSKKGCIEALCNKYKFNDLVTPTQYPSPNETLTNVKNPPFPCQESSRLSRLLDWTNSLLRIFSCFVLDIYDIIYNIKTFEPLGKNYPQ